MWRALTRARPGGTGHGPGSGRFCRRGKPCRHTADCKRVWHAGPSCGAVDSPIHAGPWRRRARPASCGPAGSATVHADARLSDGHSRWREAAAAPATKRGPRSARLRDAEGARTPAGLRRLSSERCDRAQAAPLLTERGDPRQPGLRGHPRRSRVRTERPDGSDRPLPTTAPPTVPIVGPASSSRTGAWPAEGTAP